MKIIEYLASAGVLLGLFLASGTCVLADESRFDQKFAAWAEILDTYLEDGLVDYELLQGSPELLNTQLEIISRIPKSEYDAWPDADKQAFWLNVYNIGTVKIILDHYPIRKAFGFQGFTYPTNSIQQIPLVWKRDAVAVFGETLSLNDIEHEILRKEFSEPRIHFALVCASIGCPVLRDELYIGSRLDAQLNDQTLTFLTDPGKFRYDVTEDTVYLSPIFKWFDGDFDSAGGVMAFIKKHIPSETRAVNSQSRQSWLKYDWSLNEQR